MKRCSQCMRMRCSTCGQPGTPCPALQQHEEEQRSQEQSRIQARALLDSIAAEWPGEQRAEEPGEEELDDMLSAYVERGPAPPTVEWIPRAAGDRFADAYLKALKQHTAELDEHPGSSDWQPTRWRALGATHGPDLEARKPATGPEGVSFLEPT